MAVNMQNSIFEVTLELRPSPVHFGEFSKDLVLRWLLVLLIRVVIVHIGITGKHNVLISDELASHLMSIELTLLLEASRRKGLRLLLNLLRKETFLNSLTLVSWVLVLDFLFNDIHVLNLLIWVRRWALPAHLMYSWCRSRCCHKLGFRLYLRLGLRLGLWSWLFLLSWGWWLIRSVVVEEVCILVAVVTIVV